MPLPVPIVSLGVTVNVTVPELPGVPLRLIVPVPLPEIVRPVGFVTPESASVTAPVPPVEVIDWLYDNPTSPAGSDKGVSAIAGFTAKE